MVTVNEAYQMILSTPAPAAIARVDISQAVGYTLAESVHADRDFPPFNRVAMDGIAIAYQAFENGSKNFRISSIQAAGEPPKSLTNDTGCIEVMTGTVLPLGADTVIRYEDLTILDGIASISEVPITKGQNIHQKGADAKEGDLLLEVGTRVSPAEVAILAAVGKRFVQVFSFPKTAIISGGDELVDIDETPELHQIRRSNVYALGAAMNNMHWHADLYHFPDDKLILESKVKELLRRYDVLIFSGGVSKGKFDYIPDVLESAGVQKRFHHVAQRPGKPFWFGISTEGKTVFALPGNPVSTYMCFYRFIKPWIEASLGGVPQELEAVLSADVNVNLPLTYFLQVYVRLEGAVMKAYPVGGGGSGDFSNLKNVSGFLELPPSEKGFLTGQVFRYYPFR